MAVRLPQVLRAQPLGDERHERLRGFLGDEVRAPGEQRESRSTEELTQPIGHVHREERILLAPDQEHRDVERGELALAAGEPAAVDGARRPEERGRVARERSNRRFDELLRHSPLLRDPEVEGQADHALDELRSLLVRLGGLQHPDALDRPHVERGGVEEHESIGAGVEGEELRDDPTEIVPDGREPLLARYHTGVVKTYEGPFERYQRHTQFDPTPIGQDRLVKHKYAADSYPIEIPNESPTHNVLYVTLFLTDG